MKSVVKILIGIIGGLILIVGAMTFLNGWNLMPRDTHPPCEKLPTVEKARVALANHQDLIEEIKGQGVGILVEVGRPCPKDQSRGLVMVSYTSRSERDAVANLLRDREGFGVPVHLVKR